MSGSVAWAGQPERNKIMVVNFELRDVSPIPNTEQEIQRTEQIDTVIRDVLKEAGYTLMPPCPKLAEASQQGLGYLYDRPEVAGKIGRECGADYVLMGQTWKPSFLFVFPQVQVVDTRAGLAREQLVPVSRVVQLEASTLDRNVTEEAAKKLGRQIVDKLGSNARQ
ncbi:MAG TPA: DUF2380 domain-containing protein [Methylophilaceae bacterium]|nr:DUF2380 domain-containing protein [Methylophilaceae bacterium]